MSRKRTKDGAPEVTLPITPMLDMTFQLLTFFIFTYHPTALDGQFDCSLPGAGPAPVTAQETPPPVATDLPPEKTQLTVLLKARRDGRADGSVSAVLVQPTGGDEILLTNTAALGQYLAERRSRGQMAATDDIRIQAESKLKYAFVIDALDVCVRSGFTRVGFAAPPDLGEQ